MVTTLNKSNTELDEKNRWATTWECFLDALRLYGRPFELDVCAEPATAKVKRFIVSPEWFDDNRGYPIIYGRSNRKRNALRIVGIDALCSDWGNHFWCNPPFDLKLEFLARYRSQLKKKYSGMMLLPYEPLTAWWAEHVAPYAECVYEPVGRYNFYEVDGVTPKAGANFGSVLVKFSPEGNNGSVIVPRIPFDRFRLSKKRDERANQIIQLRGLLMKPKVDLWLD
ncbi:DNA N-6-adenine-methyltransferase [Vibrio sonorensis]|uniref:DNA N-6-adenine-methyltransferase n=1 Tax=Vibrio sonorensis TaxID=1004316 RepID=UPI0008DA4047|nr:DNA N-6-adenine-methyltransferase [Vibrio sonorensis]